MALANALTVLRDDLRAIFRNDPAARNLAEVLLYPGLHAIILHRLAHTLWRQRWPFMPRLLSQLSRFLTGIEIHPGARIGRGFFIDHGMGVVIGETTEIGNWVMLYQGVTLGGTGKQQGKRHPTLEDGVVVGVGASVLGAITIGRAARIGGGAVVVKDVPPHATAVGVPARIVATRDPSPVRHAVSRVFPILRVKCCAVCTRRSSNWRCALPILRILPKHTVLSTT